MTREEMETRLFDLLLRDWSAMVPDQRKSYANFNPERVKRAGVSLDDPYIPRAPGEPGPIWRGEAMTDEKLDALLVESLKVDWPTMSLKNRKHYASYRPDRVAKAGVSLDDPIVPRKREEPER